jgi:hypothetical protein
LASLTLPPMRATTKPPKIGSMTLLGSMDR